MKIISLIVSFFVFQSCGGVEVNAEPEKSEVNLGSEDEEEETEEVSSSDEDLGPVSEPLPEKKRRANVVEELKLAHDHPGVTEFVSSNYCLGSYLHDCWIRSGFATVYDDGTWDISIEFHQTGDNLPYTIDKQVVEQDVGTHAFLLSDEAKIGDDDTYGFKMLWAVVDVVSGKVSIVYDWQGDGPRNQGDDLVEELTWVEN